MTEHPDPTRKPEKPAHRMDRIRRPIGLIWAIIGVVTTIAGLLTFLLVDLRDIGSALHPSPPTPTTTAPTSTPAPGPDDIVVLVPDFAGGKGVAAADRIYAALVTRVETNHLTGLYPARLPGQAPLNAEQAEQVGSGFGALPPSW